MAVLANTTPICSATDINRLLKISNLIGSTLVLDIILGLLCFRELRVKCPLMLISAIHPYSTIIVEFGSIIIAGPLIFWPL